MEALVHNELLEIEKYIFPATSPSKEVPVQTQQARPVQLEKKPKLMQYKHQAPKDTRAPRCIEQEIAVYLASEDLLEPEDFWYKYKHDFPLLSRLYMKVLCVVASGSPVKRVFSVAGNLLRPRRSRMNVKLLSALILLKCNFDLL